MKARGLFATRVPFEYATLRIVPRVDRGEFINAGVIVYSRALNALYARVHLDPNRLLALDPDADVAAITAALNATAQTCGQHACGPVAGEAIGKRFRWLTAPRSTVIQPSPVHTGLTTNAEAEADRLLALLVLTPIR